MFKRKSVLYTPISRNSITNKKAIYTHNKNLSFSNRLKHKNFILLLIGFLLSSFGIFTLFSRTIVYTPVRFLNFSSNSTNFATSSFILFLGIVLVAFNFKHILGYVIIGIGVLIICVSILSSLRLAYIQTSLFKTIFIFSMILIGFVILIKTIKSIYIR